MTNEIEIWKDVPIEFTDGLIIKASNFGRIIHNDKIIKTHTGAKGKYGLYQTFRVNKKTTKYAHHFVFYAHSGMLVEELKKGRVIFKNDTDTTINGIYRCWYCDLLFDESTAVDGYNEIPDEPEIEANHPVYGSFKYNKWYTVYLPYKKEESSTKETRATDEYSILIKNSLTSPCVIRNNVRNNIVKYHCNMSNTDLYTALKPTKTSKSQRYQLIHVILSSVFPEIMPLDHGDHIDDNSNNNHITNMQWLSPSDNARKGQIKTIEIKNTIVDVKKVILPESYSDEIWKKLVLDGKEMKYQISNRGRIKNSNGITYGSLLRGKKYRYTSLSFGKDGSAVKYYLHHLVWIAFNGPIESGKIILHDDFAPLHPDGTYRNWLEDLRIGTHSENNDDINFHKRQIKANKADKISKTNNISTITPIANAGAGKDINEESV